MFSAHRRQACMNEIQRLRVEGLIDRQGPAQERGTLTIKDITVPLKQIYMNRLATDEITGHHLVCLLKYNEHVLATKSVPTLPGLKAVRFPDTLILDEVYADFKVNYLFSMIFWKFNNFNINSGHNGNLRHDCSTWSPFPRREIPHWLQRQEEDQQSQALRVQPRIPTSSVARWSKCRPHTSLGSVWLHHLLNSRDQAEVLGHQRSGVECESFEWKCFLEGWQQDHRGCGPLRIFDHVRWYQWIWGMA